ncbi:MAG: hypothetical protein ABL967_03545 [Bryobacteraceae bacterium]
MLLNQSGCVPKSIVVMLLAATVLTAQGYRIDAFAGGGLPDGRAVDKADLGTITGHAVDRAGNLYLALSNSHIVVRVGTDGIVTRVAGNGLAGSSGDGGPATEARLYYIQGLTVGPKGELYIADWASGNVRMVSNGIITTVAGGGTADYASGPMPAPGAALYPSALAIDSAGDLLVLDNTRIARVSNGVIRLASTIQSGVPEPYLATSLQNQWNYGVLAVDSLGKMYVPTSAVIPATNIGDLKPPVDFIAAIGGTAIQATASGVAVDSRNNLYYSSGDAVWRAGSGTPFVGTGTKGYSGDGRSATLAQLNTPTQIAFDANDNLYIIDTGNRCVRKVSNGIITTVAGAITNASIGDGGPASGGQLFASAAAVGPDGAVYVADGWDNRVRKVVNGVITTVAGNGTLGFSGDGGPAISAQLNQPIAVAVDAAGDLYIADYGNNRIRKVSNGQIETLIHTDSAPTEIAIGPGGPLYFHSFNGDLWALSGGTLTTVPVSSRFLGVDVLGNIYMLNRANPPSASAIVRYSNGTQSTIAVTGAGISSMAVDPSGNVYYAESGVIYKSANGVGVRIAGGGAGEGEGINALSVKFENAEVLAGGADGRVYITDGYPGRVRVLTPLSPDGCAFHLEKNGQAFSASGGSGTISIGAGAGCTWSVFNVPSWMTMTGTIVGSGNGVVTYQVGNNGGLARSATLTIGTLSFAVEQQAASVNGLIAAGALAHVTSQGTWNFTLDAVNLGPTDSTVRFNFSDNSGDSLPLPLTFPQVTSAPGATQAATLDRTLSPNAQVILQSTGPDSAAALIGAGRLSATGTTGGFGIFSNPTYGWNAVVPLETRNAAKYSLAFDNTGSLATGVAISNPTNSPANVPVILRDDTGAQIALGSIPLAAQGHSSFMLNDPQLGFAAANGKRGTLEFQTPGLGTQNPGQISVLGLRANGPALTTLPVLASSDAPGGTIAHVTYNGGFTSTFYVVNTGATTSSFTMRFYDEGGNTLTVPLLLPQSNIPVTTSALTRTLTPGAMLVVETVADDAEKAVVGSAQLTTEGGISGFEIFRWTTFGQEASVPLETRTPGSFELVFDNTGALTTGVALSNASTLATNVAVNIFDDMGNLMQKATIPLSGRGHTSFMLPLTYPATANKRGMVEFVVPAGGQINAIGLRAKADGTLTTIPVLVR